MKRFFTPSVIFKSNFKNPIPPEDRFFCYSCGITTVLLQIIFFKQEYNNYHSCQQHH